MILEFRRFILSSLGFLLLAFFWQPLWAALHGALAKLPSPTQSLTTPPAPVGDVPSKDSLAKSRSYGKLPIYFEPNVGQTDSQVKFIARGSGVTTFLTATEAVFSLPIPDWRLPIEEHEDNDAVVIPSLDLGLRTAARREAATDSKSLRYDFQKPQSAISNRQSAITMRLVGANPRGQIDGLDHLPGISNYFIGNEPGNWRTNIPQYAKVHYRDVYPGIDLVYRGDSGQMEYDLVVGPGWDPKAIQIAF